MCTLSISFSLSLSFNACMFEWRWTNVNLWKEWMLVLVQKKGERRNGTKNISNNLPLVSPFIIIFGYGPLSPIALHVSQQSLKSQLKSISNACKALELFFFFLLQFVSISLTINDTRQTEMQIYFENEWETKLSCVWVCVCRFLFFALSYICSFPTWYKCAMRLYKKRQLANVFDAEMNYAKYHVVILCVNT